jgi:hypothetical protein
MRFVRAALLVAGPAAVCVGAAAPEAMADAPANDPCFTAPVQAQTAQRAGKLLESRRLFESCARNVCPAEIVSDCSHWLSDVEAATPSVVLAARDAQHADLLDTRVSVDGAEAASVGARAVALDPGAHHFVFQRPGSPDVKVDVVLREGEKNRDVSATFGASPGAAPAVDHGSAGRPVPLSAWIAGGVGLVGLASFATFGTAGVLQRSSEHCDTGCAGSQKNSVDTKYLVANISLGVGLVGLGVATWLYLARPTAEAPRTAVLDVVPTPGGAVASFETTF